MIKKRYLSILFTTIFLAIFVISSIQALDPTNITERYGDDIDPETGLPKELKTLTDVGEKFSEGEITEEYLKQEWTKILNNSESGKYLVSTFEFTEEIFSIFNPFWKLVLGEEFSWSWVFFLSLLIWIAFIIILYAPSKAFTDVNPLLTLLFSTVIATIIGKAGTIATITEKLTTMLTNIWLVGLAFIITFAGLFFYYQFIGDLGKGMKKASDEEKRKESQKYIEAHGEVSKEALEEAAKK